MTARGADGRFVSDSDVRRLARDLDRRWPAMHADLAPVVTLARDLVDTTGVRSTLAACFPAWDLDDPSLPVLAETLAVLDGGAS